MNRNGQPAASVVIAAHRERGNIEACLRSVLECSGPDEFEVVVVDDGSTDDTRMLVAGLAAGDPRLILVSRPRGGKARALNRAVGQSRSCVCLITDADCRVPASWVAGSLVNSVAGNE